LGDSGVVNVRRKNGCLLSRERNCCTWAAIVKDGSTTFWKLAVVTGFEIGAWRCAAPWNRPKDSPVRQGEGESAKALRRGSELKLNPKLAGLGALGR